MRWSELFPLVCKPVVHGGFKVRRKAIVCYVWGFLRASRAITPKGFVFVFFFVFVFVFVLAIFAIITPSRFSALFPSF